MTKLLRPLGHIETAMTVQHHILGGNTQGAQLVGVLGNIPQKAFIEAIHLLFDQYTALRCRIVRLENQFCFFMHDDFERIKINIIHTSATDDWLRVFEHEVDERLDPEQSLWRCTLVEGPNHGDTKIILTMHHAIVDGSGFFVLFGDLLSYLDLLLEGHSVSPQPLGMPKPIDEFLFSGSDVPRKNNAVVCPPIPFCHDIELDKRTTKTLLSHLPPDDTLRFEAKCKSKRLSVNSVLSAALVLASINGGCFQGPVSFKTAVSLRDRASAEVPTHMLGCYITVADATLDVTGLNIEQIAKDYDKQLLSNMLSVCLKRQTGSIDAFENYSLGVKESRSFVQGMGITGAGRVELSLNYKSFTLNDWQTLNNRVGGNLAIVLHTLSFADSLKFGFVYAEPIMDPMVVRRISDAFMTVLQEFCSEGLH